MFQVGDYVVDSTNGICKIEDTVKLDYATDKNKVYFLMIPVKELKAEVYIPIDKAEGRLRKTLTETQIYDLLDVINDINPITIENDKEREKVYREALGSGNPKLLVSVIKTLFFRREKRSQEGKKNTAIDDKYFKQAEEVLYSEIGFVLKLSNEDVKVMIKSKVSDN